MKINLLFLALSLSSLTMATAQKCTNMTVLNTTDLSSAFNSILISPECNLPSGSNETTFLKPGALSVHIAEDANADKVVIRMEPSDMYIPFVRENQLRFGVNTFPDNDGELKNAGIEITLPQGQVNHVRVESSSFQSVAMTMMSEVTCEIFCSLCSAYINSTAKVTYRHVDRQGRAQIDAPEISVAQDGSFATTFLKGIATGTQMNEGNELVVEGNATITATGSENMLVVSGGCGMYEQTGNNTCDEQPGVKVVVEDLDCLARTNAENWTCPANTGSANSLMLSSLTFWMAATAATVLMVI